MTDEELEMKRVREEADQVIKEVEEILAKAERKREKERAFAEKCRKEREQQELEWEAKWEKERMEKEKLEKGEKKVSLWVCLAIAFGLPALVLAVPDAPAGSYLASLLALTVGVPVIPILMGIALVFIADHYKKKKKDK